MCLTLAILRKRSLPLTTDSPSESFKPRYSCYLSEETAHNSALVIFKQLNPLNAELNHICQLLALLGSHLILHVSEVRVKPTAAIKIYK